MQREILDSTDVDPTLRPKLLKHSGIVVPDQAEQCLQTQLGIAGQHLVYGFPVLLIEMHEERGVNDEEPWLYRSVGLDEFQDDIQED